MHRPDLPHQILPLSYQGSDLLGFPLVHLGDVHQDADLVVHEPYVCFHDHAGIDHSRVDGQGLAGLDDAGVGFGGGHGGIVP